MRESIKNIFEKWLKKKLHFHTKKEKNPKFFREREVWWASLGKNIGYEMDGKNDLFEIPILILKGYSIRNGFYPSNKYSNKRTKALVS
ncbi:hypothetical protein KKG22_04495 [Patescibacteria group bacterium]|nr:hypothetical protein [Patescibacteria group bacterium]MBU1721385.1 hypothetical protein [Patescibacteria group bacterium]MBU1900761.1 hypothetical protein [Patescibacteria group bacterium]